MWRWRWVQGVVLAIGLGLNQGAGARLPFDGGDTEFTLAALVQGVQATRAACEQVRGAVWAEVNDQERECLRYWVAGLSAGREAQALIFFSGDLLAGDVLTFPDYLATSPGKVQAAAQSRSAQLGVPVVIVGRPGTYGSSGEHKQRRRAAESRLISAALDALKERLGLTELTLAGVSGGGHVVAALLTLRSDIVCAVPASAVSSPRMRWERRGLTVDLTGHADSFEPVEHLQAGRFHPRLRVFVLGDPLDENVPWSTQLPLARRLAELGVRVEIVEGQGSDRQRHHLNASAMTLGALCSQGFDTPHILRRAQQGLRG